MKGQASSNHSRKWHWMHNRTPSPTVIPLPWAITAHTNLGRRAGWPRKFFLMSHKAYYVIILNTEEVANWLSGHSQAALPWQHRTNGSLERRQMRMGLFVPSDGLHHCNYSFLLSDSACPINQKRGHWVFENQGQLYSADCVLRYWCMGERSLQLSFVPHTHQQKWHR